MRRSTLEKVRVYNSITTGLRAINIPFFQEQQSFKAFGHLMSNQFERFGMTGQTVANQFLRAAVSSCGAAVEARGFSRGLGYWKSQAAKRRKKILVGRNPIPLAWLLAMAHSLPRLKSRATLVRHSVADWLRPLPEI